MVGIITLYAPDVGGSISPSAGVYEVLEGNQFTVQATAATGYRFVKWVDPGFDPPSDLSTQSTYTWTVFGDLRLKPVFEAVGGNGGTTPPLPLPLITGALLAAGLAGYLVLRKSGY